MEWCDHESTTALLVCDKCAQRIEAVVDAAMALTRAVNVTELRHLEEALVEACRAYEQTQEVER